VLGNINAQQVLNDTRIAVETAINVAEERQSQVINASVHAHHQEMESVRRDARPACEANKSLQDLVLRLQQGQDAEAARATRLLELQGNEMRTVQREKESAAGAVQAHAAAWAAANHSDTSSSGNQFHELSSGGKASQPGVLTSLSRNVFRYARATPSEQATTCPTAGGYEGSQSSMPERQLFHIDLCNHDPELGVAPGGRAEHSESSGVLDTAAAGRPILPASPQLPLVSESSGPEVATLAVTQTVTAPTVTVRGQDRKPSPSKPAGSSKDGDRKPGKGDKDGKKDDKDKGNDKGPPKPDRSESSGGGKKEPDESEPEDSNPEPEPSLPDDKEKEVGQGNRRQGTRTALP
jgi:hypothetical protein